MKKLEKSQFEKIARVNRGFIVRYTTNRGDYYIKQVTIGNWIDACNDVINDEDPTHESMKQLRNFIKTGVHYSKTGKLIAELV